MSSFSINTSFLKSSKGGPAPPAHAASTTTRKHSRSRSKSGSKSRSSHSVSAPTRTATTSAKSSMSLMDTLTDLEADRNRMKLDIASTREKYTELSKVHASTKTKLSDALVRERRLQHSSSTLTERLDVTRKELARALQAGEESNDFFKSMKKTADQLTQKRYALEAEFSQIRDKVTRVEAKLKASLQATSVAKEEVHRLTTKCDNQTKELARLSHELEITTSSLNGSRQTSAKLTKELDDLKTISQQEKKTVLDQYSSLEAKLEEKNTEHAAALASLATAQSDIAKKEGTIVELKAVIVSKDQTLGELEMSLNSTRTSLDETALNFANASTKLEDAEKTKEHLETEVASLKTSMEALTVTHKAQLEENEAKHAETIQDLSDVKAKLTSAVKVSEEKEQIVIRLREDLQAKDSELETLNGILADHKAEIKVLTSQLSDLNKESSAKEQMASNVQNEIKELQQARDALRDELETASTRNDELEDQVSQLTKDLKTKTRECKSSASKVSTLERENESSLADIKSQLDAKIEECQDKDEKIESLQKDLDLARNPAPKPSQPAAKYIVPDKKKPIQFKTKLTRDSSTKTGQSTQKTPKTAPIKSNQNNYRHSTVKRPTRAAAPTSFQVETPSDEEVGDTEMAERDDSDESELVVNDSFDWSAEVHHPPPPPQRAIVPVPQVKRKTKAKSVRKPLAPVRKYTYAHPSSSSSPNARPRTTKGRALNKTYTTVHHTTTTHRHESATGVDLFGFPDSS